MILIYQMHVRDVNGRLDGLPHSEREPYLGGNEPEGHVGDGLRDRGIRWDGCLTR
jgi:pullulanase/glycogen debranching enzyme